MYVAPFLTLEVSALYSAWHASPSDQTLLNYNTDSTFIHPAPTFALKGLHSICIHSFQITHFGLDTGCITPLFSFNYDPSPTYISASVTRVSGQWKVYSPLLINSLSMESRNTKTATQGDGLPVGQPVAPAGAHRSISTIVYLNIDHCMTHCSHPRGTFRWYPRQDFDANASYSIEPRWGLEDTISFSDTKNWFRVLLDTQSDRIFYEAMNPNLTSANFDVVHGDDFEEPPPANLPPPASPPGKMFDAMCYDGYLILTTYLQPNVHQLTFWPAHKTHRRSTLPSASWAVIVTGTRVIRHETPLVAMRRETDIQCVSHYK